MQTSKDLVLAIDSGKSTDIQNSFDAIMNNKLHQAIDAYRSAVVEDVFGGTNESADLDQQENAEE